MALVLSACPSEGDAPTDTPEPNVTVSPESTDTPQPVPTDTMVPLPTDTPLPAPTDTPVPSGNVWLADYRSDPIELPDEQMYERLFDTINNPRQYPNMMSLAASGDSYMCGRGMNQALTSLLAVYRYTGDVRVLDEVTDVMQVLRNESIGYWGTPYLHIRFLFQNDTYYGGERHMDEILCNSLIMEYAYIVSEYTPPNTRHNYQEISNWWRNTYVESTLAKWKVKGEPIKNLAHIWTADARMAYFLWKMTDDPHWKTKVDKRISEFRNMFKYDANGYVYWDHRVPNYGNDPLGCQPSEYAYLTMNSVLPLFFEGYRFTESDMRMFASTFASRVLTKGTDATAYTICGSGTNRMEDWLLANGMALMLWDSSGKIRTTTANAAPLYPAGNMDRNVEILSWFLLEDTQVQPRFMGLSLLPSRAVGTPYPVEMVLRYSDGSEVTYELYSDPVDTPTPLPTATNTPTPTPSSTPTPEATVEFPTPTPENTLVPITPVPTSEPPLSQCFGTVVATNLNLRSGPGIVNSIVGSLRGGSRVRIIEVRYVDVFNSLGGLSRTDEWVRVLTATQEGWAAAYYMGEDYVTYDVSQDCLDLRFNTDNARSGNIGVFVHYIVGGNLDQFLSQTYRLTSANIPFGAVVIDDPNACAKVMAAGGTCVYRVNAGGDNPDLSLPPAQAATVYVNRMYTHLSNMMSYGIFPDYFAFGNEGDYTNIEWWDGFMSAAIKYSDRLGFPPIVAFNFFTHQPEREWVQALDRTWYQLYRNKGMLGMHAYGFYDGALLCDMNPWLTDRDTFVRQWFDEFGYPMPLIGYTEVHRERGDTAVSTLAIQDIACYTDKQNANKDIAFLAFWTSGFTGNMVPADSLDGWYADMFDAIRGVL